MKTYITRLKRGKGFGYQHNGAMVSSLAELDRIASLAIPPAWQEVKISTHPNSKIQAEGRDNKGRKQYIYHPSHREKQEKAKFDRITSFAGKLPGLRKRVKKDLARKRFDRRKVCAAAVSLMDETYFRIGNEQYAKENGHFGLTTLRSKHINVKGSTITFDFVGKSGQQQHKEVSDQQISRVIRKLDEMPGYELFRYFDSDGETHNLTSTDVNAYIKEIMGNEYTAKDFRTWGGTLMATIELAKLARPETKSERKKAMTAAVKRVAKKLGNTPAIARSSYIDPRILEMFESSDGIGEVYGTIKDMKKSAHLNSDEQCAIKLLS